MLTTSKLAWMQVKYQPRRKSTNIFSLWDCEKWLYLPWREQDNAAYACWEALLLSPGFKQKKLNNTQGPFRLLSLVHTWLTAGLYFWEAFSPILLEGTVFFFLVLGLWSCTQKQSNQLFSSVQQMGALEWLLEVENPSGTNNSHYVCDFVNG